MGTTIKRSRLIVVTLAFAALAAAFWIWSDAGPERSEAANEQAKTEMHLEIDGKLGATQVHCDSRTQTTCKLLKGSTFALHIIPSAIPVGGYAGTQILLEYGSLLYKPTEDSADEFTWPPAAKATRSPGAPTGKEGSIGHGAVTAFFPDPKTGLFPVSFQKTSIVNLTFNCAENDQTPEQSHSNLIRLVDFIESPAGTVYLLDDGTTTLVPNVSGFTVECTAPPTATPTNTPTPTPTNTPTPTVTNTPTPVTCLTAPPATPFKQPHPCDTDQDGCSDASESATNQLLGGDRDYLYFWDFFDVWTHPQGEPAAWERNRVINLFDIFAVAMRFGSGPLLTKEEAHAAALTEPVDENGYHAAYDRGEIIGDDTYDRAPADGSINIVDDILGVAQQFGHNCDH